MGVRRVVKGVVKTPWILKFSAKKFVFLVSRGKKQISPLFSPPGKILEKSSSPRLEKILPTPLLVTSLVW